MKRIMKRVLLVLCMVTCLFSLSACSSAKEEASGVDPAIADSLIQQTVGLLENIVSIPGEQMQLLIDQNREAGQEFMAAGLENYVGLADEVGAYVSSDGGHVEEIEDGYSISVNAVFANRPATFVIGLDKDMVNINSMSLNPIYTTGENMVRAGLNTLMGMGTVFVVLILISLLIGCFTFINKWETGRKKDTPAPTPVVAAPAAPVAATENLTDDLELVAVITAAIAAASGNTTTDGLVVRSIRRVPVSHWKKA